MNAASEIPAVLLERREPAWRRHLARVTALLGVLFLAATLLIAIGTRTGHVGLSAISTGSMSGYADPGSLVVGIETAASDLDVGDVITTSRSDVQDGSLVTHRIVEITHRADGSATLQLKGDANSARDVRPYEIRSTKRVVAVVPAIGSQVHWLLGPGLWLLLAWSAQTIATYLLWPRRREIDLLAYARMRDALAEPGHPPGHGGEGWRVRFDPLRPNGAGLVNPSEERLPG